MDTLVDQAEDQFCKNFCQAPEPARQALHKIAEKFDDKGIVVIALDDAEELPSDIAAALRRIFTQAPSPAPRVWLYFVGASPALARLAPTRGEAYSARIDTGSLRLPSTFTCFQMTVARPPPPKRVEDIFDVGNMARLGRSMLSTHARNPAARERLDTLILHKILGPQWSSHLDCRPSMAKDQASLEKLFCLLQHRLAFHRLVATTKGGLAPQKLLSKDSSSRPRSDANGLAAQCLLSWSRIECAQRTAGSCCRREPAHSE